MHHQSKLQGIRPIGDGDAMFRPAKNSEFAFQFPNLLAHDEGASLQNAHYAVMDVVLKKGVLILDACKFHHMLHQMWLREMQSLKQSKCVLVDCMSA